MSPINFKITSNKEVSEQFLQRNIHDFFAACEYISQLPYKRNVNKKNLLCIFEDQYGTCSTKHAILRKLALENNHPEVKLILGIFKMDSCYAPKIKKTLESCGLHYIPEAHNYLKIGEQYFDFTMPNSTYSTIEKKIFVEKEIEFDEITDEKIIIHQEFLQNWIEDHNLRFTLTELWKIREQCIADLQR